MKLPKQVYIPYIGAMYDLLSRTFFLVTGMTFLMQTRNTFYNSNDSLLRDTFGTYATLMLVLMFMCGVVMLLAHIFLVPSHNKYCQDQAVKDGRSVMYDKTCEMYNKMLEIDERMKAIERKL